MAGLGAACGTLTLMRASGCNPPSFRRPSHPGGPGAVVSMKSWVIGQAQYWPQSKQSLPPGWTGWEGSSWNLGSTGRQQMGAWMVDVQPPQQRPAAGPLLLWWGWRPPGQVPQGLRDAGGGEAQPAQNGPASCPRIHLCSGRIRWRPLIAELWRHHGDSSSQQN